MKKNMAVLGLMLISQVASAAGVTKLQRAAAAFINKSTIARRAGLSVVKPSQLQGRFLNGAHGFETANVKTKLGAFPQNVTVQFDNGKFSNVQVQPAGKPGRLF